MEPFRLDFVGVGPQRTGTSWLHQVLLCHPQLCFPKDVKETMFFDLHYEQGIAWYAAYFNHRQAGQLCGEIGPTYFDSAAAAERIHQLNPNCQIIINLRDPISRAWSSYRHHLAKGRTRGTFDEAIRQIPQIVEAGRYARHIPRWLQTFDEERVAFVLFEDIDSRPAAVLSSICTFLGVTAIALPEKAKERISAASMPRFPRLAGIVSRGAAWLRAHRLHKVNELGKALGLTRVYTGGRDTLATPTPHIRLRLLETYEADIAFVESLMGRALAAWRQPASAERSMDSASIGSN